MTKKRTHDLRSMALADSSKHLRRFKVTWFEALTKRNADLAKAVRELGETWINGDDELVEAYPSKQAIARFISSLPGVNARPQSIARWLDGLK